MAKIKFMPIQNPIDKLYADVTGMPFPVSAAVTGGEAELKFGTLNIEMLDPLYMIIGSVSMTSNQDMTGIQVNVDSEDFISVSVQLIPSANNPKLLVLNDDYANSFGELYYNPDGDATTLLQPEDTAGPNIKYHVQHNWGTGTIEYLAHGRDGESDPEFRLTCEGDLSEYQMNAISSAIEQGGTARIEDFSVAIDPMNVMYFEAAERSFENGHYTYVGYAADNEYAEVTTWTDFLCENWETIDPNALYGMSEVDVYTTEQGDTPIAQVGTAIRATFGTYVPECTSPEV